MVGRRFLGPAQLLAGRGAEEYWRAAAGRAYYALFVECRDALLRWGFIIPPRDNVHSFVRLRFFTTASAELQGIGRALEDLCRLRNEADYRTTAPGNFASAVPASDALQEARDALSLLDQIVGDPARQAAAVAAIRAAWP